MTDHTPLPDGRRENVRMDLADLPDYLAEIEEARARFPELKLLAGLECEYAPEYQSFYKDEILGRLGLDYLIGGCHAFPYEGRWVGPHGHMRNHPARLRAYTDYLIEAFASRLFTFYAHPDVFGCSYLPWDENTAAARDICQAAVELDLPLEINGYGLRKPTIGTPDGSRRMYPLIPFWEIAGECGVRYVAASDAHRPEDVAASIPECHELARRFGLREAVLPPMFDA
jgi:histidinol-phosphatase (PHP family)